MISFTYGEAAAFLCIYFVADVVVRLVWDSVKRQYFDRGAK